MDERYIRKIIREVVEQHYQTYGLGKYDRGKFKAIQNDRIIPRNKPLGGLWASPVGSKDDWREFNRSEAYRVYDDDDYFEFKFKPNARILRIRTSADIKSLPMQWDNRTMTNIDPRYKDTIWAYPDFEEIIKNYDAIEYFCNKETYEPLSGWDCDSVLVLNPDVIEIIKDNPHDKSTKRKMTPEEMMAYDRSRGWFDESIIRGVVRDIIEEQVSPELA